MPPIYRHEQVLASVNSEPGRGGYLDQIDSSTDAGGASTTLTGAHTAGTRVLTVGSNSGYAANDYIQIGVSGASNAEIRRVKSTSGSTTITLDYPLGFHHAASETVDEKTSAAPSGISFTTFLPGVYETITVPDLTPELTPQYFLRTTGSRNWSYIYRGRQTFNGSWPNFILLNGYPLRFPIGSVRTVASAVSGGSTTLSGAHSKGEREINVASGAGFADGEYIEIERGGTNPEVRQIISGGGTTTFVLNYPLMFAHSSGVTVSEVTSGATYTHTIVETASLDTLTWNLRMIDSGETSANDLIRRYVGGIINRGTITAEEGGLLRMSWDDTQFLDLVHNQVDHSSLSGTHPMPKSSGALLTPAGIGGDVPHSASDEGTPTYPTTEPYYFSQGSLTMFGIEFARVRNFSVEINNNVDPRYYIRDDGSERTPSELQEQTREYRMTATIALPDSLASTATTRTLWKELILEGNYTGAMQGFDMTLVFTRGANDTITLTSPPSTAGTGLDAQGCFFVRAPTNIGTESPLQVEGEILLRSIDLVVVDSIPVYP